MTTTQELLSSIVDSIDEQISDLKPGIQRQINLAAIVMELTNLKRLVGILPPDTENIADIKNTLVIIINDTTAIQKGIPDGSKSLTDFGYVLGDINTLQLLLETSKDNDILISILASVVSKIEGLFNYRPDVSAVLKDLDALKSLKGGPADAIAFHDFHVLQIAFKNVWMQAFDKNLRGQAEDLYKETACLYADAGITMPASDSINDIKQLKEFISEVKNNNPAISVPPLAQIPTIVIHAFPDAATTWYLLSLEQQSTIITLAQQFSASSENRQNDIKQQVADIIKTPPSNTSRLTKLIAELGKSLSEPYAFDIFAPDSYNFGLLLTYRQEWTPGPYQAGDLRATIPLAPGETKKYSKKTNIKKSRTQKEIEKSVSSSSYQTSDSQRAEAEIMQKATTATNFKMTTDGSFNIGIGNIHASTEFTANQAAESVNNKKQFRETAVKAAQEYRLERNLEVDSSSSIETEETISGEISNPNNEITVTYLFYELQRRYKISEFLHRVRPVIMVAQEVPAPHEIDEEWLIQYQWVIARVLLDDSFRSALDYLTSGMAGDEVSIEVVKAQWENIHKTASSLEGQLNLQLELRNHYRDTLITETKNEAISEADADNQGWIAKSVEKTFGDPQGFDVAKSEAIRKAAEAQLQYLEDTIVATQDKFRQAHDAYQKATDRYAAALQKQYSRYVAIDQLRIHVKQNIIYYMQAIWAHESPDQRFFRLYNKQVTCPKPSVSKQVWTIRHTSKGDIKVLLKKGGLPEIDDTPVDLIEIADLDNPLGYKGNYIMFPLKKPVYITTYMLQEFIDEHFGLKDPDGFALWNELLTQKTATGTPKTVADIAKDEIAPKLKGEELTPVQKQKLVQDFTTFINSSNNAPDEIIIPTGQLFIEALPGTHPLLEDFKLLHRTEDVRKVKAEVRHAELENLRLASRLIAAQNDKDPKANNMLEDPDIEKKIIVEGKADINPGDN